MAQCGSVDFICGCILLLALTCAVICNDQREKESQPDAQEGEKDIVQDILQTDHHVSESQPDAQEGEKDIVQDILQTDYHVSESQPDAQEGEKDIVQDILQTDHHVSDLLTETAQLRLLQIYREHIRPLEQAYRFTDLNRDALSEGDMIAKPMVLFLGPWSTGKTTMINYLVKNENTAWKLHTGAEPTTTDFTVINHGQTARTVKGIQLVSDNTKNYTPLQKFGLAFLERFQGMELPSSLLKQVTLVDTPGIIENKKQQERGYPFYDVCQWFIDRAQLIFLVFDPSKLDIGSELEEMFKRLKGHEGKLRLILNKADTVTSQELMRVYGALFWSLAPFVKEVEPPRVYVGSMWSRPYHPNTMHSLFEEEKLSLLTDLQQALRYQLENKIADTCRHAFLVRLHALAVDSYFQAYQARKSKFFGDNDQLWADIKNNPDQYAVIKRLSQNDDISSHDLPTPEMYQKFFSKNDLSHFKPLSYHCSLWSDCAMDRLLKAINTELPNLLRDLKSKNVTAGSCPKDSQSCQ